MCVCVCVCVCYLGCFKMEHYVCVTWAVLKWNIMCVCVCFAVLKWNIVCVCVCVCVNWALLKWNIVCMYVLLGLFKNGKCVCLCVCDPYIHLFPTVTWHLGPVLPCVLLSLYVTPSFTSTSL